MKTILTAKNIKRSFGGNQAVAGVSFSVEEGKITAIIGPNGSGKSTLFNLLTQTLKKDAGTCTIAGYVTEQDSDYSLSKTMISRTFQDTRAFIYLSIRQHIEMALRDDDETFFKNFFAKKRTYDEEIEDILKQVGLTKELDALGGDLSYGQKKLLMIATAIAKKNRILFLDEPVAGVNPALRTKIKNIFIELRTAGATIVLIEHDMNFVASLADHVVVMNLGKIIAEGSAAEVLAHKEVLRVYLGSE